jgi:spore coat protein A
MDRAPRSRVAILERPVGLSGQSRLRPSRACRVLLSSSFAVALLAGPVARADVVDLVPVQDATLLSEDTRKANGSGLFIFVGSTDDGDQRRALIQFDIAGNLPPGATINSVSLQLSVNRSQVAGDRAERLHRVLTPWSEGPSTPGGEEGGGDVAMLHDSTWRYTDYDPQVEPNSGRWTSLGGDFSATISGQAIVGGEGSLPIWTAAQMTADVQGWFDAPATNHGWLLKEFIESLPGTAKRYGSRQNLDSLERPVLTVDFTAVQGAGACCDGGGTGACGVVLSGDCTGTYQGDGSLCSPNPCNSGCCLPDAQATCMDVTPASCTALGGKVQGAACATVVCPVVLTPYLDPLPLPAVAQPVTGSSGGTATYHIAMRETQQQLHAELAGPTTVWGYDDGNGATFPGPTLEASVGAPVSVTWENDLRDTTTDLLRTEHYLEVDLCPHGAPQNADARTVVHLHGGHMEAAYDGYPEATFPPGQQRVYEYPNWQLPSTLWYHDHALGITRLNVYMGLAGFWLIRDAFEQSLGLPSGEFEIPLAIQDRSFHPDGSFLYPADWQGTFFGDQILVNGKVWPYLDVKPGKYRFRLLNGAGSRTLRLALSTGDPFQLLGMEGGLLPAATTLSQVTLGPGERADIVVDFSLYAIGSEILLVNDAPAPFPGVGGAVPDVIQFIVSTLPGDPPHTAPLPATLRPMEVLDELDATVFRNFHLDKAPDACTGDSAWLIQSIDDMGGVLGDKWVDITELPELGETEVWKFVNLSGMTHPMHMHLVMFQVLDRQACQKSAGQCTPIGDPTLPPPHEWGWKDTVQVGPDEIVRVIARFEDYKGLFSYHCHILEHEDHEMMRQFQAVATIAHCEDGLDNDGDGLTDFAGGDPGCEVTTDPSERGPTLTCDDGIDNDGDAATDHPADPTCGSPFGVTEAPEPSSFALGLSAGLALLMLLRRRRVGTKRG